jgi:sialic acid synthase SpsE
VPVGYADHTEGDSELALAAPLMALGLGACVLEKHLTHDRSARGEDWEAALNPDEMARFVRLVRGVEKIFGSAFVRPFSTAELDYRKVCKKRAVARVAICRDEAITADKVAFKRSDDGVSPEEAALLVGRRALRDLAPNDAITWDVVA